MGARWPRAAAVALSDDRGWHAGADRLVTASGDSGRGDRKDSASALQARSGRAMGRGDHRPRAAGHRRALGVARSAGGLAVSYTHLRAHETDSYLVCRLLLEKK